MHKIILASASPRRKEILEMAGIKFSIIPSEAEEIITSTEPSEIVKELSKQKACEVFSKIDDSNVMVIGADTIVYCDGEIMGKPKNTEDAFRMIKKLQGNKHYVYTGVTVCIRTNNSESFKTFFSSSEVEVYPISDEGINAYIATKEPFDKAGAYAIQGKFSIYIKSLNGEYNNVVGLPISKLHHELSEIGIDILNYK